MKDSDRDLHFRWHHQDDDDWYNGIPGRERQFNRVTPLGKSTPDANLTLLVTIEEAARLLGVGRTTMFKFIGRGEIKSVRLGRRRFIARKSLESFVEELPTM